MNFPEFGPAIDVNKMSVETCMAIVDQLKRQSLVMQNTRFKNRWEEIRTITLSTVCMNKEKLGDGDV